MELNKKELKQLDFTYDGRPVSARKLGFADAFGIVSNDGVVKHDDACSIIQKCLVFSDTEKRVFESDEEVSEKDADVMMELFNQICSYSLKSFEEAEKN